MSVARRSSCFLTSTPPRLALIAALLAAPLAHAQSGPGTALGTGPGNVQISLEAYNDLVKSAAERPKPSPLGYALGRADLQVGVEESEARTSATVEASIALTVYEDRWVLIPVLPTGTAVSEVTVDGDAAQLAPTPAGLAWSTTKAGNYAMRLVYSVDAARSELGMSLAIPTPQASATQLNATLPGTSLDVAVIPATASSVTSDGAETTLRASIPTTSGVQLSWRLPVTQSHILSRGEYVGELRSEASDAVLFTCTYTVDLMTAETVTLPLLATSVTLSDLKVDGKSASILVQDDKFATLVKGRGTHKVVAGFEVPVVRGDGPPKIALTIPQIPVSRFDLTLPGKKEITVEPATSVSLRPVGTGTLATLFLPMTETVTLTWNEAVPQEVKAELRANLSLYHVAHAEENVLYVRAMAEYEVTRGETNLITLEVPSDVAVNRVEATEGGIGDWRVNKRDRGRSELQVFLDRQVAETFRFDVYYERSIDATKHEAAVPLLAGVGVHRQRGMVALLSSKELTLKPTADKDLTRVGENQLPAWVRQAIEMTIAHTYKYGEMLPVLMVETTAPEHKEGKFDAQVDTLVSLGDVTLKGAATVEVNVKSGSIMELALALPAGVNVLSLTAPSLRTPHKVTPTDQQQLIELQFTQEMEGQFRVDVTYERILGETESEVIVPTLAVRGAEVEQGRIAVEALSAVEVQPATDKQLSSLDIKDLPQQLILKTTNPILLAYKYVQVDPPYTLGLKLARHKNIEVQRATIDSAAYSTLFTRDGLAVTTAHFIVRNSREQFLKVRLPQDSEVWSAFVDGRPEKPARESEETKGDAASTVLIKIINAAQGFPVDVIYATPVSKIGRLGTVSAQLPRPYIVVTSTTWDVFLPDGLTYGSPDSTMEVVDEGTRVSREEMEQSVSAKGAAGGSGGMVEPLRISVPASGVRYRFEKLYANKSDEEAEFSMPYASGGGTALAHIITALGTLLLWVGLFFALTGRGPLKRRFMLGGAGVGLLMLLATIAYLGTSPITFIVITVLLVAAAGLKAWRDARRNRPKPPPASKGTPTAVPTPAPAPAPTREADAAAVGDAAPTPPAATGTAPTGGDGPSGGSAPQA